MEITISMLHLILATIVVIGAGFTVAQSFDRIGRYADLFSQANLSEVILYQTDKTTDNSGMSTNIINHYSIT